METRWLQSPWHKVETDVLIIPLFEDENLEQPPVAEINKQLNGLLQELKATEEWKGRPGEFTILHRPAGLAVKRLVLAGAGKQREFDAAAIRKLLFSSVRRIRSWNLPRVAVYRRSDADLSRAAQAALEGVLLGVFDPDEYKTADRSRNFLQEIALVANENLDRTLLEEAMRRGQVIGRAVNLARSLVNAPGNLMKPPVLAERAREIARETGLEVEIWDERELEERGMHAILAVGRGSEHPPRFIILRHRGTVPPETPPLVLIGKGVTFDSGGISLKPAQSMEEMKCDKAGGCAVLAAMQAIAELQLPRHVVGLIPCVENLPGSRAQRPGDIIRTFSGKTVEVINTDAEGRLILADAIHYARQLAPEFILDIATLTGACIVALGHLRAGLFCNNAQLYHRVLLASERSGEKLWRLPLDKEYREEIESFVADIKNVGNRWGGAITAAKFLEEFVGDLPWCHIDMAGVDLFQEKEGKGPTGFGVRTLVELATLEG